MSDNVYAKEVTFLDRKLLASNVKWESREAVSQLMSPPMPPNEASNIISKLRDALAKKSGLDFPKMVQPVASKLSGGTRVVIAVNLLRQHFADEIDAASGGGGRGLNPMQSRPRPPGRGV